MKSGRGRIFFFFPQNKLTNLLKEAEGDIEEGRAKLAENVMKIILIVEGKAPQHSTYLQNKGNK